MLAVRIRDGWNISESVVGVLFQKILVAVDGSEIGDYALNVAVDIGEKYSSEVDIVHVKPISNVPSTMPVVDPLIGAPTVNPAGPSVQIAESNSSELLLRVRQNIVNERKLRSKAILKESDDVGSEVVKIAAEGPYDLVVVGSSGKGGLKSLLLGSVSKKVAKHAKSSVLIVRNRITNSTKLLLGYDGSEDSKRALLSSIDLAAKLHARLDVVGVVALPIATEGYIVTDMDRWDREMRSCVDEAVTQIVAAGIQSIGKVLNATDVSNAIIEESKKESYDFIVVGTKGYSGIKSLLLGSVASGVAGGAKTNVFLIR